jgi:hypothetical protein
MVAAITQIPPEQIRQAAPPSWRVVTSMLGGSAIGLALQFVGKFEQLIHVPVFCGAGLIRQSANGSGEAAAVLLARFVLPVGKERIHHRPRGRGEGAGH